MVFIHEIHFKIKGKITGLWNICHYDLYLIYGQTLGHTCTIQNQRAWCYTAVLQLALYREAGHSSCPLLLPLCPSEAALCLISTPDIKPYILLKISWKSDKNLKKLSLCQSQFHVYSSLRHLLWNGIIFCNMPWYSAYHMTHSALILAWLCRKCPTWHPSALKS